MDGFVSKVERHTRSYSRQENTVFTEGELSHEKEVEGDSEAWSVGNQRRRECRDGTRDVIEFHPIHVDAVRANARKQKENRTGNEQKWIRLTISIKERVKCPDPAAVGSNGRTHPQC